MKLSRRGFIRAAAAAIAGAPLAQAVAAAAPPIASGAISIPFKTLPTNVYIRGPRYKVMFDRIVTPRGLTFGDHLKSAMPGMRDNYPGA